MVGASCNRKGTYSCLRCKVCYCDRHVMGNANTKLAKGELPKCKKCSFQLQETADLSMSGAWHTASLASAETTDACVEDCHAWLGVHVPVCLCLCLCGGVWVCACVCVCVAVWLYCLSWCAHLQRGATTTAARVPHETTPAACLATSSG